MHNFENKSINIQRLKASLQSAHVNGRVSVLEIQVKTGVHQSQISRICRGLFRRASPNVFAVANALGVELHTEKAKGKRRVPEVIQNALDFAWDGSQAQANQYAKLIAAVGALVQR